MKPKINEMITLEWNGVKYQMRLNFINGSERDGWFSIAGYMKEIGNVSNTGNRANKNNND